jgi:hypothetical protein
MRPMICRLSLGKSLNRRHGPLMISGFLTSPSGAPFDGACEPSCGLDFDESAIASLAGVSRSLVDLDGASDNLLISVPGVGVDAKSL